MGQDGEKIRATSEVWSSLCAGGQILFSRKCVNLADTIVCEDVYQCCGLNESQYVGCINVPCGVETTCEINN